MINIRKIVSFIGRFRKGYKALDKIQILLYNMVYIALYPINRIFFLLFNRIILHPMFFFNKFKIKNSDGIFICRDNVDLDIVSEDFEYEIRKYFKEFERGTFIDIGANIGKYTIMVGNRLNGNGKIISIEPHPGNFEILKKNIELNKCENVIPLNLACWNESDTLKLFIHEDHPLLSSAIRPSKRHIKVDANSLDSILDKLKIKNIDLIKIDVEGAEPKVLEGMKNILKYQRPKIIFEAWDGSYVSACRRILESSNYEIKHLDKMYWMGLHK